MCLPLLILTMMGCSERVYPTADSNIRSPSSAWKRLLSESTSAAGTDYDKIAQKREILDAYLTWIGEHGPEEDNMSYKQDDRKIAFLINAYNASVIAGVLRNRDAASVMDVSTGLFPAGGAGFFLGQTFRIDAEWITLYHLEHQYLLGDYEEPLIHAGLNCASVGCPPLRYYTDKGLDNELDVAMHDFLASEQGMRQTDDGYEFTELLSWYEDHFVDWSDATDLCDYLSRYTDEAPSAWLTERVGQCSLQWFSYDWSLNHAAEP